jgi:hypothetical protein
MIRLMKGVDWEGKIITLLVELNLRFYHLEVVAHLRSTWSGFRRLRRCLIGMSILTKRSVRWLHWSLLIMLCCGERTWKFKWEWINTLRWLWKGWWRSLYMITITGVIHKTLDIATKFFKCRGVCDGVWATNNTLWIDRNPITDHNWVYWWVEEDIANVVKL